MDSTFTVICRRFYCHWTINSSAIVFLVTSPTTSFTVSVSLFCAIWVLFRKQKQMKKNVHSSSLNIFDSRSRPLDFSQQSFSSHFLLSYEKLGFLNFLFSSKKENYYIKFSRLELYWFFIEARKSKQTLSISRPDTENFHDFTDCFLLLFTIRETFGQSTRKSVKMPKKKNLILRKEIPLEENFSLNKRTQLRLNESHENVKSEWGKV